MVRHVNFGGFVGVMPSVKRVSPCGVCMMGRFFVLSGLMMLSCFAMVTRGMRMMLCRLLMVLGCFLGHSGVSSVWLPVALLRETTKRRHQSFDKHFWAERTRHFRRREVSPCPLWHAHNGLKSDITACPFCADITRMWDSFCDLVHISSRGCVVAVVTISTTNIAR